jgi:hypothetical protein
VVKTGSSPIIFTHCAEEGAAFLNGLISRSFVGSTPTCATGYFVFVASEIFLENIKQYAKFVIFLKNDDYLYFYQNKMQVEMGARDSILVVRDCQIFQKRHTKSHSSAG